MSTTKHPNLIDRIDETVDQYRLDTEANRKPGHCRRGHERADVMCPTEWPCYWCKLSVAANVPGGRGPSDECLQHLGEEVTS